VFIACRRRTRTRVNGRPACTQHVEQVKAWEERRASKADAANNEGGTVSAKVITVDDLVDTSGAAALLGVEPTSVTRYRARREGFPEPLRHFGGAPVWTRAQILDWAASRPGRGAGGGRPKKAPVAAKAEDPIREDREAGVFRHGWCEKAHRTRAAAEKCHAKAGRS
jgi:hypothetical protein